MTPEKNTRRDFILVIRSSMGWTGTTRFSSRCAASEIVFDILLVKNLSKIESGKLDEVGDINIK